jgi:hypothetical protein
VDWIHLAQDREQLQGFVKMVMNFRFLWQMGNFWTNWVTPVLRKDSATWS